MSVVTIGLAAGTLMGMALILTYILGWASTAFHVETDPRVESVNDALPGANCGGCGYVGCGDYAEAVVLDAVPVNLCTVGGESCTAELAEIMDVDVGAALPFLPVVHCGARYDDRLGRSEYKGELRCVAANLIADVQGCAYGCLGFGDCSGVCNYGALHVVDGLATIDYEKCVGCGACARVCPRNIITITPFKARRMLAAACSNHDLGKEVTRVCKVGCLGCRACSRISDLFVIVNNLSTLNYDEYTPDCLEELENARKRCPRQRLIFVGKESSESLEDEDSELQEVVTPDFKTTVDDTEWRG